MSSYSCSRSRGPAPCSALKSILKLFWKFQSNTGLNWFFKLSVWYNQWLSALDDIFDCHHLLFCKTIHLIRWHLIFLYSGKVCLSLLKTMECTCFQLNFLHPRLVCTCVLGDTFSWWEGVNNFITVCFRCTTTFVLSYTSTWSSPIAYSLGIVYRSEMFLWIHCTIMASKSAVWNFKFSHNCSHKNAIKIVFIRSHHASPSYYDRKC